MRGPERPYLDPFEGVGDPYYLDILTYANGPYFILSKKGVPYLPIFPFFIGASDIARARAYGR
mgnify:CR=1 FL=1